MRSESEFRTRIAYLEVAKARLLIPPVMVSPAPGKHVAPEKLREVGESVSYEAGHISMVPDDVDVKELFSSGNATLESVNGELAGLYWALSEEGVR